MQKVLGANGVKQARQGDYHLEVIPELSPAWEKDKHLVQVQKDKIVGFGEVTGHSHVLTGDAVLQSLFGERVAVTKSSTILNHDTHGPIPMLGNLVVRIRRQQEYNGRNRRSWVRD